jgi:histidine phosphotransferase ChpT
MRPDLAALVGSRICHDLISPLGAIGNGVELMALTDGNTDAEMALIAESVANANARIRFFRIAYGSAAVEQMVGRSEVLSVLAASARGGRFTYFWQVEGDQPRRDVRAAFLLLQCFESAFPLGGDIHVTMQGDTWELTAQGDRLKIDAPLWDSLTKPRSRHEHTAAEVQFALLPKVLSDNRRTLAVEYGENRIRATF